MVRACFLLVAWYGSMLLFWSRSAQPTRPYFSLPPEGRDSSLLLWLIILYSSSPWYSLGQIDPYPTSISVFSFSWTIILSRIPLLPFLPTRTNYAKSNFFHLFALTGQFSQSNFNSYKFSKTNSIVVLTAKSLHFFWKFTDNFIFRLSRKSTSIFQKYPERNLCFVLVPISIRFFIFFRSQFHSCFWSQLPFDFIVNKIYKNRVPRLSRRSYSSINRIR